ncbi:Holliday junction DNA helicase RuvA [Candidatus Collierbacteria bacterium RIFOXYD1_FULL_40_9]|uniref:Holliday junction branch migration complex subunit RuvA n=1 Tax=Candidatus Collierbacteria bacterium RIFOXYD1_FULL_40_9 TaxID=1817731 RepID=A0A1F5FPI3_9BACT|nr:MAG: Holliday junction DNA helicase RuvA [Candidatus Collierbacteria bacterium RIFOXYD1_FULL_40_9]
MIGFIEGTIKHAQKNKVLIFTGGVGYAVFIPENHGLKTNDKTSLFIHTHFRDNELSLFGFKTADELTLFEILINVSGVGPKTALNIFSTSTPDRIVDAIRDSNLLFFTSISGVGKKTGQRIILDLKSKLSKGDISLQKLEGDSELLESLLALGFQKTEVSGIISKIDTNVSLENQIKQALKLLNK